MLGEPSFANRAAELAAWSRDNDGAEHGAELVEQLALGRLASGEELRGWDSNPQPRG